MEAIDALIDAIGAIDVLANIGLILIGLETLRQRDRITRIEGALDTVIREQAKENSV